jgi:hypothetical protein
MGLRVCESRAVRLKSGQAGVRNLVKEGPFVALAFVPSGRLLSLAWLGAHTWVAALEQTTLARLSQSRSARFYAYAVNFSTASQNISISGRVV